MWVIVALANLAVLIILILCVRPDMTFHIEVGQRQRLRMRLLWLFYLISKELARKKRKPEEIDSQRNQASSLPRENNGAKNPIASIKHLKIPEQLDFLSIGN